MELMQVAQMIEDKINDLTQLKSQLTLVSENKAIAVSNYDKIVAKTIIGLRNGLSYGIEAYKIENPPVSIIDKVAKGVCWKEKLVMDESETAYKNLIHNIDISKAQLNAYQSMNRYLA